MEHIKKYFSLWLALQTKWKIASALVVLIVLSLILN